MIRLLVRTAEILSLLIAIILVVPPLESTEANQYVGDINRLIISAALFLGSRVLRNGYLRPGLVISIFEVVGFAAIFYVAQIMISKLVAV